jgi:hypothetical protein
MRGTFLFGNHKSRLGRVTRDTRDGNRNFESLLELGRGIGYGSVQAWGHGTCILTALSGDT